MDERPPYPSEIIAAEMKLDGTDDPRPSKGGAPTLQAMRVFCPEWDQRMAPGGFDTCVDALQRRLQSGELVAVHGPDSEPVPAVLWRSYSWRDRGDLVDSVVRGPDRRVLSGIRIMRARSRPQGAAPSMADLKEWFAAIDWNHPPTKGAAFIAARRHFGDGLTRRLFDRAWSAHAPPHVKKPGAKPRDAGESLR